MGLVTISDEQLRAVLRSSVEPVTLRDPDGHILGVFTPIDPAALQPRISNEELERRFADTAANRYTTEQVLARLRAIRSPS